MTGLHAAGGGVRPETSSTMWHVTLTLSGTSVPSAAIRSALERLAHEHPFLLAGRYAPDRAEVRYWEEAPTAQVVADLALRLWGEHKASCDLPDWRVVGLEVVDRDTFHQRGRSAHSAGGLVVAGGVTPF
ncbi:MAG: hypothetical protein R2737_05855 [Candidatus Nanopelagicales bacterium]